MIEEICCISDEGKAAKNEWLNVDSNFLQSLYTVYIKNQDNSFSILYYTLLILQNFFKKGNYTLHTIASLIVLTHAFYHTRIENLLKRSV